jgi:hypothetical protein
MARLSLGILSAVLVVLAGCSGNTGTNPGGMTNVEKGSFKAKADNVTVSQGDHATTKISIDRDKNFHEDVAVIVAPTDPKIKVSPMKFEFKGSESNSKEIDVSADKDAQVKGYPIKVEFKPAQGVSTSVDFTVTVKEKK